MENACSKSEIDVYRPVDVQVALTHGHWHTYYPLQSLNNNSTSLEFTIPATSNEVIDMNNISLYLAGKVHKGDATQTALANDNHVCPSNNFLHSMIRHIDAHINGQLVTRTSRDYPYKAMFLKLTQTDMPRGGQKDSQLIMEGFCMDDPGCKNIITGNKANKGLVKRRELIKNSREFEVRGNPCIDLFQCDRALIPGADITLKIYLNDPKFYLIDATTVVADKCATAAVTLTSAELYVRRVAVAPSFVNAMKDELKLRPALYPFTRREMLSISIPANVTSVVKENLFQGKLATRYFFALVKSTSYTGDITANPFKFKKTNLSEICLTENGNPMSQKAVKVNFTNKAKVINAYRLLLESIGGIGDRALSTPITLEHFIDGSTIFCFTRSPDLNHGCHHLPNQQGNLTLHLNLSAAENNVNTLICMAEFDAVMAIHEDNNVTTDYST